MKDKVIMIYGNLFPGGRPGTWSGWLNIHAQEGQPPATAKVIDLALNGTEASVTLKLDGLEEYRYIEASVETMGDVLADQVEAAGISGAALARTPKPRPAPGGWRGLAAALLGVNR